MAADAAASETYKQSNIDKFMITLAKNILFKKRQRERDSSGIEWCIEDTQREKTYLKKTNKTHEFAQC